jgi:carbamoyltransferase
MKRVLGVKTTHDAAVALIDGDDLVFSIELEKLTGGKRYTSMFTLDNMRVVMEREGVRASELDAIVFDGWTDSIDRRIPELKLAPYFEHENGHGYATDTHTEFEVDGVKAFSYMHTTDHVIGAYVMSPFSKDCTPADVIVFEGRGMRAYRVDPNTRAVVCLGTLSKFEAMIYSIMASYGAPFADVPVPRLSTQTMVGHYGKREWPGKIMSWIAHGEPIDHIVSSLEKYYTRVLHQAADVPRGFIEHSLMRIAMSAGMTSGASTADIFASVHSWIESVLVRAVLNELPFTDIQLGKHIIFTGGSALNIKWNSAMRSALRTYRDGDLYVSPVPNDSGNAIGAAAAHRWYTDDTFHTLNWSLYSGPMIQRGYISRPRGWEEQPCSIEVLGKLLHDNPTTPVLLLDGRAEIGPRALGHRSIIMAATEASNKDMLNRIKGREPWRPVAPMVREQDAPALFTPGTPDEYMIFDHKITQTTMDMFPAITHIDGTARVQTVSPDNELLHALLSAYADASDAGYGLLCNTSANLNGYGFFDSLHEAMRWGKVHNIWSGGVLYAAVGNI